MSLDRVFSRRQVEEDTGPPTRWKRFCRACGAVVYHPYAQLLVTVCILFSSVLLAITNPVKDSPEWFTIVELVAVSVFIAEAALKLVADGVRTYFRSGWNWLDFLVAALGVVELSVGSNVNLAALRLLRVARLFKSFPLFEGANAIVVALGRGSRLIFNVLFVLTFLYSILALFSMETMASGQRRRCVDSSSGQEFVPPEPEPRLFCNIQDNHWKDGLQCEDVNVEGLGVSLSCVDTGNNPGVGVNHYDNFGAAMFTVFQISTLEGWSTLAYNVMDAEMPLASVFFIITIILANFFIINMSFGVIFVVFSAGWERYRASKQDVISATITQNADVMTMEETGVVQRTMPTSPLGSHASVLSQLTNNPGSFMISPSRQAWSPSRPRPNPNASWQDRTLAAMTSWWRRVRRSCAAKAAQCEPVTAVFRAVGLSRTFQALSVLLVVAMTAAMAVDTENLSTDSRKVYNAVQVALTVVFAVEIFIRIIAFPKFFRSAVNITDVVIVLLSLVALPFTATDLSRADERNDNLVTFFRIVPVFRIFRMVRVLQLFPRTQRLLATAVKSFSTVLHLVLLTVFASLVYAIVGVQLFGGRMKRDADGFPPRANFDDLASALLTLFIAATGEDWNELYYDLKETGRPYLAPLYLLPWLLLATFVLLNLFIAVITENFEVEEHDREAYQEHLLSVAANAHVKGTVSRQSWGSLPSVHAAVARHRRGSEVETVKFDVTTKRVEVQKVASPLSPFVRHPSSLNVDEVLGAVRGVRESPASPNLRSLSPHTPPSVGAAKDASPPVARTPSGSPPATAEGSEVEQRRDGLTASGGAVLRHPHVHAVIRDTGSGVGAAAGGGAPVLPPLRNVGNTRAVSFDVQLPSQSAALPLPTPRERRERRMSQRQERAMKRNAARALELATGGAKPAAKNWAVAMNRLRGKRLFASISAGPKATPASASRVAPASLHAAATSAAAAAAATSDTTPVTPLRSAPAADGALHSVLKLKRVSAAWPIDNLSPETASSPDATDRVVPLHGIHRGESTVPDALRRAKLEFQVYTHWTRLAADRRNPQSQTSQSRRGSVSGSGAVRESALSPVTESTSRCDSVFETVADRFEALQDYTEDKWLLLSACMRGRDRSLLLFPPKHRVRLAAQRLVNHRMWHWLSLAVILLSSVSLALESRSDKLDSRLLFRGLDVFFAAFFSLEVLVNAVARGFLVGPEPFLNNGWNVLTLVVAIGAVIDVSSGVRYNESVAGGCPNTSDFSNLVRLLRSLRPLRILEHFSASRALVNALALGAPDIMGAVVVVLIVFYAFAVAGRELFRGQFGSCNDPSVPDRATCTGFFLLDGDVTLRQWTVPPTNFDSLPNAMRALFEVASLSGWPVVLFAAIDVNGFERQPQRDRHYFHAWYMVVFIFIASFIILQVFVGIILENMSRVRGTSLLTTVQRQWTHIKKFVLAYSPASEFKTLEQRLMALRVKKLFRGKSTGGGVKVRGLRDLAPRLRTSKVQPATAETSNVLKLWPRTPADTNQQSTEAKLYAFSPSEDGFHSVNGSPEGELKVYPAPLPNNPNEATSSSMPPSSPPEPGTNHRADVGVSSELESSPECCTSPGGDATSPQRHPRHPVSPVHTHNRIRTGNTPIREVMRELEAANNGGSFIQRPTTAPPPVDYRQPYVVQGWKALRRLCFDMAVPCGDDKNNCHHENGRFHLLHNHFDDLVLVIVMLNALLLASNHDPSSATYRRFFDAGNHVFFGLFLFEICIRLLAVGVRDYIHDPWNVFDLLIASGGLVTISTRTGIAAVISRVFRVGRVFRVVRASATLRVLFMTMLLSFSALAKVTVLLFLAIFAYSVVGMEFYSSLNIARSDRWAHPYTDVIDAFNITSVNDAVPDGMLAAVPSPYEALNRHASFETIGKALLLMFRVATGEEWETVYHDCLRCTPWSTVFFFSFVVLITYILLNFYLGTVWQQFEHTYTIETGAVSYEDLERYRRVWSRLDPKGVGYIPFSKVRTLLFLFSNPDDWKGRREAVRRATAVGRRHGLGGATPNGGATTTGGLPSRRLGATHGRASRSDSSDDGGDDHDGGGGSSCRVTNLTGDTDVETAIASGTAGIRGGAAAGAGHRGEDANNAELEQQRRDIALQVAAATVASTSRRSAFQEFVFHCLITRRWWNVMRLELVSIARRFTTMHYIVAYQRALLRGGDPMKHLPPHAKTLHRVMQTLNAQGHTSAEKLGQVVAVAHVGTEQEQLMPFGSLLSALVQWRLTSACLPTHERLEREIALKFWHRSVLVSDVQALVRGYLARKRAKGRAPMAAVVVEEGLSPLVPRAGAGAGAGAGTSAGGDGGDRGDFGGSDHSVTSVSVAKHDVASRSSGSLLPHQPDATDGEDPRTS